MIPILAGLVLLTILYAVLSLWSRSVRRERLEDEWDRDRPTPDRDAFISDGIRDYDRSLRRRLILGVYVVPVVFALVMIYLTNYH